MNPCVLICRVERFPVVLFNSVILRCVLLGSHFSTAVMLILTVRSSSGIFFRARLSPSPHLKKVFLLFVLLGLVRYIRKKNLGFKYDCKVDCHPGKTAQNQSRFRYCRTKKKMLQTDVIIGQANTNENNAQQYSYEDGESREK